MSWLRRWVSRPARVVAALWGGTTARQRRLSGGLLLAYVAIAVSCMVLLLGEYQSMQRQSREVASAHIVSYARSTGEHVHNLFNHMGNQLALIATVWRTREGDRSAPDAVQKLLRDLAVDQRHTPEIQGLWIFDRKGDLLASTMPVPPSLNIADRPHFKLASQAPIGSLEAIVASIPRSRLDGKPTLAIAYPRHDRAGHFDGVVTATLSLGNVSREIEAMHPHDGARYAVYNANTGAWLLGTVLAGAAVPFPRPDGTLPPMQVKLSTYSPPGSDAQFNVGMVRLQRFPLVITVLEPEAGLSLEAQRRLQLLVMGTLTGLLLLGGLMSLLYRQYGRFRRNTSSLLRSIEGKDAMLMAMHEGYVVQDETGTVVECNPQAARILGLNQEGLLLQNTMTPGLRCIRPDHTPYPDAEHPALRALHSGTALVDELMGVYLEDESLRWITISAHPFRRPGEAKLSVVCTFSDITHTHELEEQVKRSSRRLQGLLDNAPDAIITVDLNSVIIDANRCAGTLFGYEPAALIGQPLQLLLPQSMTASHGQLVRGFAKEAQNGRKMAPNRKVTARHADGSLMPVEVALAAFHEQGRPTFMAIIRDVRQRVEREAALQELLQGITQSPHGFLILDMEGYIQYANHAFARTTPYLIDALLGLEWLTLDVDDMARPSWVAVRQAIVETGIWQDDVRQRDARGNNVTVRYVLSLVRDEDGNALKLVGVTEDVTARLQVEQELERHRSQLEDLVAERTLDLVIAKTAAEEALMSKSAFVANMSHEVRTPLNAILGFAQVLRKEVQDPRVLDRLEKIDTASQQLLAIINDILDFSKLEAGKLDIASEPVSISAALEYAADLARSKIGHKPVKVSVGVEAGVPEWVNSDPIRLGQVVGNLAANAAKFTERGEITLSARVLSSDAGHCQIRLEVSDTGIGIDPIHQDKLFQPFAQADNSITRRYGGTGLGLAICRNIITAMGGSIGLQSEPGMGSVFWIELPFGLSECGEARIKPKAVGRPATPQAEQRFRGRLLVAEDNPMNQMLVTAMLVPLGLDPVMVDNGLAAIEACQGELFDLILMDLQMPEMDGLTATRALKADPRTRDIPIVAMTANAFTEDRAACRAAGMVDFVEKPVQLPHLVEVLAKYLAPAPAPPLRDAQPVSAELVGDFRAGPLARAAAQAGLLDIARARGPVDDNAVILESALEMFVDYHASLPQGLQSALSAGQLKEAERLAHTLKGTAYAIGAVPVGAAAEALERSIKQGAPDQGQLAQLSAATSALAHCLQVEQGRAKATLAELRDQLRRNDVAAQRWVAQYAHYLVPLGEEAEEQIVQAIRLFQFSAALDVLGEDVHAE